MSLPKNIWVLMDDRPGHINQLIGLCDRLAEKMPVSIQWLDMDRYPITPLDCVIKRNPWPELGAPDWVIGAGRRSHYPLLFCKRIFGAYCIVLMNPSLPYWWYDACIIPVHDKPGRANNILVTDGVLNTVQPVLNRKASHQGLLLIGGINTHYHWDSDFVAKQVFQLCRYHKGIRWLLTTSRRTPQGFLEALDTLAISNLKVIPVDVTPQGWVKEQLEIVDQVWVTADSVSMVFECLTSHAATGLLALQPKRRSRVVNNMNRLVDAGRVSLFDCSSNANRATEPKDVLWEADRAADWLLNRLIKD